MIVCPFTCPVNVTANIFITGKWTPIFAELENDVNRAIFVRYIAV